MRKFLLSAFFTAILVVVLSFNACGKKMVFDTERETEGGSGVGNPMQSKTLADAICSVVERCHTGMTLDKCRAGVLATAGFGPRFGLEPQKYANFAAIVQAEEAGAIRASALATQSCSAEIRDLKCADPLVQGAYDAAGAEPFAGTVFMIPTDHKSCPAVYVEPPGMLNYYVSPTGSDNNDGSETKPWATISHAANTLTLGKTGATVHVAPGTYTFAASACAGAAGSCSVKTERSGTADARIVYLSDEPGGAKIVSSGAAVLWYNAADYTDIVGFEFVGDAATNIGIQNVASYVRIVRNRIHSIPATQACATNAGGAGVRHSNRASRANDTLDNVIHDIGPLVADGQAATAYCTVVHGILYAHPEGTAANNVIYRIATNGISSWFDASGLTFANNLIFAAGARAGNGSYIGGGITIGAGEGTAGAVHENSKIVNNILRDNRGSGIEEWGSVGATNVYANNVIYGNGTPTRMLGGHTTTGTITTDPLMLNFQADGSGDYRLQATSPAVNAGTAGGAPFADHLYFARPYGGAVDIGPYEWHP